MGIEYVEYRIKIRNKKTKEVIKIVEQKPHLKGKPICFEEDFECIDIDVIYG